MKQLTADVLVSDNDSVVGGNSYVRELEKLSSMDELGRVIFGMPPPGAAGGQDNDAQLLNSLLGNLVGGGGGGGAEPDLGDLAALLGAGTGGGAGAGGPGVGAPPLASPR